MTDIPVILLAAGQSSRMGGADKLMQPVDGQPLLRRMAERALAVGPVIVALPPPDHPRYAVLEGLRLETRAIPNADEGMNASLRGAIAVVPDDAAAVMVLLADLPELTQVDLLDVRRAMVEFPDNLIWRGATETGKPGHPVIFHQSLFPELTQLQGDTGAQSVVQSHRDKVHLHRLPRNHALLDLDTPEDWTAWQGDRRS